MRLSNAVASSTPPARQMSGTPGLYKWSYSHTEPMLNSSQRFLSQAPWMAFWPGVAIFLAVLSFNLLGDGLRDALDPRHK